MGRGSQLLLVAIVAVASAAMGHPVPPSVVPSSAENPTGTVDSTAPFAVASYPVTWRSAADAPPGTVDAAPFVVESYPVTWRSAADPPPRTVDNAPFAVASYPVTWRSAVDPPPGTVDKAPFAVASYPVTWASAADTPVDGNPAPFTSASYPVTWPSAADTPVAKASATASRHRLHVKPGMLFLRKNLYPGALLPQGTKLAMAGESTPPRFVSRRDAEAIPFSSTELERILQTFRIPAGSTRAEQVAYTLRTCEGSSTDPHTCATSREAEEGFAADALGSKNLRRVITLLHGADEPAAYTVATRGVSSIGGGALVACHPMDYPYLVRYCHRPAMVETLRVRLNVVDGDKVTLAATAVAICHLNTTSWDSRFFQMLNANKGEQICHYMPQNYVTYMSID